MAIIKTKFGRTIVNFDDEKHRFWIGTGGEWIPSVTSFTGVVDKSTVLIGWAIKLMREFLLQKIRDGESINEYDVEEASQQHRKRKEEAADVGTQIHDIVSKWIKKQKYEIPDNEKVRNGFEAFLNFQKEHGYKWIDSEKIVYSAKHGYAGILDATAFDKNKKRVLVDFKSSNGIYPEYYLQTAGYQIAEEEQTKKKFDYRVIIKFGKENGSFQAVEIHDKTQDKKAFLAALELKKRIDTIKG